MKKPIYKRWWFIVIVVIAILGAIGSGLDNSETDAPATTGKIDEATEDTLGAVSKKRIAVDKELKVKKVTAGISSVTIEDSTIEIPMWWRHWASNDKVHFSVLAYLSVYQGDQHLELIGGEDSMLKKVDKGVDSMVRVKYELIDEETPVTIKIIATTDSAEEEVITVEID